MLYGSKKFSIKNRRGVSNIIGSLIVLAIVASIGSVILFQGLNHINAFSYDLTYHDKEHVNELREDIIFEHVRFPPSEKNLELDLANVGSVDSTILSVTVVRIDNQELIINKETRNDTILIEDHTKIILTSATLPNGPDQFWDSNEYRDKMYKISITTSKGNFFSTVATPFNTWDMKQKNSKSSIQRQIPKRRAVAEVISTLLLVVITVAGAVLLSNFLDESFVQGSLAVSSSADTTIKTIKLKSFDTRDGVSLMGYPNLDNETPTDLVLCGISCLSNSDNSPATGGTEFLVIQIENRSLNPIYLESLYLENILYTWDENTSDVTLNPTAGSANPGNYPRAGMYSILSDDGSLTQYSNKQIQNGEIVNLLVKLSPNHPDIELSKTVRVQLNIGTNTLSEFLIETGGAQWTLMAIDLHLKVDVDFPL